MSGWNKSASSAASDGWREAQEAMEEVKEGMAFTTDTDFVGGQWEDGEFYYQHLRNQGKGKVLTKEDHLYGIWNDGYEEESGARAQATANRMTAPIGFESAGTLKPTSEEIRGSYTPAPSQLRAQKEKEDKRKKEQTLKTPSSGIHGLGFRKQGDSVVQEPSPFSKDKEEENSEYQAAHRGRGGIGSTPHTELPSSFGNSRSTSRRKHDQQEESQRVGIGGRRSGRKTGGETEKMAKWENYTKGVGSRLLQKMGWSGSGGLREDSQAAPISVKLRPRNLGIAYGGFQEEAAENRARNQVPVEGGAPGTAAVGIKGLKVTETASSIRKKAARWKKQGKHQKQAPPQVVFKTARDLLEESAGAVNAQAIYDMTGPQQRVLSSAAQLSERGAPEHPDSALYGMPELPHNMRELISEQETAIRNNQRQLEHCERQEKLLADKERQMARAAELDQQKLETLTEVLEILDRCADRIGSSSMKRKKDQFTLENMIGVQELLKVRHSKAYRQLKLEEVCYAMMHPLLAQQVQIWRPLEEPKKLVQPLASWRLLLDEQSPHETFERAMIDLILPKLRRTIASQWRETNPAPLLELLDALHILLSVPMREMIMEQLVLPKLQRGIENWRAGPDSPRLDLWLLPWQGRIERENLQPLLDQARHKLCAALSRWHASDRSAHDALVPWQGVWSSSQFMQVMVRCIFPKLYRALKGMTVNPASQDIQPFQWIMRWESLAPQALFIALLEGVFFPQWFQALCTWLQAKPNLKEVSQWYSGWKQMFSAELLSEDRIRLQFTHALMLMQKAMQHKPGMPLSLEPPKLSRLAQAASQGNFGVMGQGIGLVSPAAGMDEGGEIQTKLAPIQVTSATFREVVARLAEKRGIVFAPNPRKQHPSGIQVYRFGNVNIVIMDRVIHRADGKGNWSPVSLDELTSTSAS